MPSKYPPPLKEQSDLFGPEPVEVMERKILAYKEWRRRQEGGEIDGQTSWMQTAGKRLQVWMPDETEVRACCKRMDTRDFKLKTQPLKMLDHCKSQEHVAILYGLDSDDFRRYVRLLENEHKVPNKGR